MLRKANVPTAGESIAGDASEVAATAMSTFEGVGVGCNERDHYEGDSSAQLATIWDLVAVMMGHRRDTLSSRW